MPTAMPWESITAAVAVLGAIWFSTMVLVKMGASKVFAWHPVLMTIAWLGFGVTGVSMYRMRQGPQGIVSKRSAHRTVQICLTVLALAGLVIIIYNKLEIAHHPIMMESAHSWFGVITLVLMLAQGGVGALKMHSLAMGEKVHAWHGTAGFALLGVALFTMCLGANEIKGGIGEPVTYTLWAIAAAVYIGVLAARYTLPYAQLTVEEETLQESRP